MCEKWNKDWHFNDHITCFSNRYDVSVHWHAWQSIHNSHRAEAEMGSGAHHTLSISLASLFARFLFALPASQRRKRSNKSHALSCTNKRARAIAHLPVCYRKKSHDRCAIMWIKVHKYIQANKRIVMCICVHITFFFLSFCCVCVYSCCLSVCSNHIIEWAKYDIWILYEEYTTPARLHITCFLPNIFPLFAINFWFFFAIYQKLAQITSFWFGGELSVWSVMRLWIERKHICVFAICKQMNTKTIGCCRMKAHSE